MINLRNTKKEEVIEMFNRLLHEEKFEEAKEVLKVLEKHSKKIEYAQLLITYGRETEDIKTIRAGYELLIRVEPDQTQKRVHRRHLAKAELRAGNVNTARAMYNALLKETKNRLSLMIDIGKLEKKIGNKNKARQCFNEVKLYGEYFGDCRKGHNIIRAKLAGGYLDIEDGDLKSAYNNFDSVVKLGGKQSIYAAEGLAKICALTGDVKKTKHSFYSAIELSLKLKDHKTEHLVVTFIQYLLYIEDYEEAEKVNEKYKDNIKKSRYFFNSFVLSKAKGDLSPEDIEKQHALTINHIIEGHVNAFGNVEELYYRVLDKMTNLDPDGDIFKCNYYISCEDYAWTIDGEKTNCILVVTTGDKTNIVTMYPVIWYGNTIKLEKKVKKLQ